MPIGVLCKTGLDECEEETCWISAELSFITWEEGVREHEGGKRVLSEVWLCSWPSDGRVSHRSTDTSSSQM